MQNEFSFKWNVKALDAHLNILHNSWSTRIVWVYRGMNNLRNITDSIELGPGKKRSKNTLKGFVYIFISIVVFEFSFL